MRPPLPIPIRRIVPPAGRRVDHTGRGFAVQNRSYGDYRRAEAAAVSAIANGSRHSLKGVKRYTIHVNGPWCITFEFEEGDAYRIDFEQYH